MKKLYIVSLLSVIFLSACSKYLDIVPDNVATLENAFSMRSTAERFLFTCYSYLPDHAELTRNPAFIAGDEAWLPPTSIPAGLEIARGNQKVVDPYMNFWEGRNGGKNLYAGIRDCNILLENIEHVPDMDEIEKRRWAAEAKFLKAYYHYWLLRMYGPIPLVRENLPITAEASKVRVPREPVDACVDYIVELLDEAAAVLPGRIEDEVAELGRITRAIALSVKAEVLVTAASPLFNGNPDYTGLAGPDGRPLFNTSHDPGKWERAAAACKEAIEFCESLGYRLYQYRPQFSQYSLSDTTLIQMSIRNSVCEPWNVEVIWGNINSRANNIQARSTPRGLDPERQTNQGTTGNFAVPLKIAEMFYTENGLPITEDVTWDYAGRFSVREGDEANRYVLKKGYFTAALNFHREPRYYASLGFDGGIWYGQGRFDDKSDDLFFVSSKRGDPASMINPTMYSVSGYWPKKLVHYQNVIGNGNTYNIQPYPWPVIRLANLYLLYAEALNETAGPSAETYRYLDLVRSRAGLPTVEESWTNFSSNPSKFTTREGLREIIRRERLIELALEGQRFWDLRRWKQAVSELNKPITGWDITQEDPASYYREATIYNQRFATRDYLWPINESELLSNENLVQNPGW